ncbi:hypothetical protein P7K49_002164 [Saguinus oedipus]|uniref:Uncharacterized protein n=1 Tax=Saguinus oedipus TaxID=9490 RepID=A0ABQ9WGI4_SAGOE|nr:hypothetical protein P7K49_002164 [Saguinus oedipus]
MAPPGFPSPPSVYPPVPDGTRDHSRWLQTCPPSHPMVSWARGRLVSSRLQPGLRGSWQRCTGPCVSTQLSVHMCAEMSTSHTWHAWNRVCKHAGLHEHLGMHAKRVWQVPLPMGSHVCRAALQILAASLEFSGRSAQGRTAPTGKIPGARPPSQRWLRQLPCPGASRVCTPTPTPTKPPALAPGPFPFPGRPMGDGKGRMEEQENLEADTKMAPGPFLFKALRGGHVAGRAFLPPCPECPPHTDARQPHVYTHRSGPGAPGTL